jgi:hypothetical protein
MKHWIAVGLAVACAGVGVGLWLAPGEAGKPAKGPAPAPVAVAPPAAPKTPVVLTEVIDVADLDPLLDPREPAATGEPFDADPPAAVPVSAPVAPERIPPAADDEPVGAEVAPMPRETMSARPVVDPSRACWYGEHRLPHQIGGGLSEDELLRRLNNFQHRNRPRIAPGVDVGVGIYF